MTMIENIRVKGIGIATSEAAAAYEREVKALQEEIATHDQTDLLAHVELLCRLGRLHESAGQLQPALLPYREAIDCLEQLDEPAAVGQIMHTCASIEHRVGNARSALKWLVDAQEKLARSGDKDLLGLCHLDRGLILKSINQLPAATNAWTAAEKCFAEIDDQRGQGHAQFLLGQLQAHESPNRARWHIDRARILYAKWLADNPRSEGIRIAAPRAPEAVDDPRSFAVDELVAFCDIRCEQLQDEASRRDAAETGVEVKADAVPPNQSIRIAGVMAATAGVGVALPIVWVQLGLAMVEPQIFHVATAALTAVAAFAGMLYVGVDSRMVQLLAPLLPCVLVYHFNTTGTLAPGIVPGSSKVTAAMSEVDPTDAAAPAGIDVVAMSEQAVAAMEAEAALNPEAARDELELAAEQHTQANDQIARAAALAKAVKLDRQLGDSDAQREHLIQLADAHSKSNHSAGELAALRELATVESAQGRTSASAATHVRIAAIAEQAGLRADAAAALLAGARAAGTAGDLDQAAALIGRAETLYRSLGDESGLGDAAMARGAMHAGRDALAASKDFTAAQEHYRKARDHAKQAIALIELAGVDLELGRSTSARRNLEEATRGCQSANDQACAARAMMVMARVSPGASNQVLAQAAGMARTAGDNTLLVETLLRQVDAEAARGSREVALRAHGEAFAACDQIADTKVQADAFLAVGIRAERIAAADRAREAYAEALRAYEKVGNRLGQIATLRRMQVLAQASDRTLAERYSSRITLLEREARQQES